MDELINLKQQLLTHIYKMLNENKSFDIFDAKIKNLNETYIDIPSMNALNSIQNEINQFKSSNDIKFCMDNISGFISNLNNKELICELLYFVDTSGMIEFQHNMKNDIEQVKEILSNLPRSKSMMG